MEKLLSGKVALITGATRGIGKGIALLFAEQGANIAFTYKASASAAEVLTAELQAFGIQAKGYASDASDFSATETLVQTVVADFGHIDILVNNAGITRDNLLLRLSEQQWDEVLNNNLKSVFNLTKNVSKLMLKKRAGSIINIGSIVGITGNAGQSNYAAAKAGMVGFSKSIAQELGSRNIRCNVVAPGFIETEMTDQLNEETRQNYLRNIPLQRFGTTREVAQTCLFLASDMSAYVSGQVISVCGALNT